MHVSYVASVQADHFDSFLRALAEHLPGFDPAEVSNAAGLREWCLEDVAAKLLTNPQERLAAAQWDGQLADGNRVFCEAFFVPTASRGYLCGLSLRGPAGAQLQDAQALAWWQRQSWTAKSLPRVTPPSFLQIAVQAHSAQPLAISHPFVEEQFGICRSERDYFKALCEDQAVELEQLRIELAESRQQWTQLSTQTAPAGAPATKDESEGGAEEERVTDLSGLPKWAEDHAQAIVVLPRALNGAKKSIFGTPSLVYAGLEFLAGPYRQYRMGKSDRKQMEQALAESTLRIAGSIGPSVAGEQGEAYFVSWRGRRRFLEFHLLRGGGRDERYCLRIYFFWSAEDQKVVVGWLPSHLDNSLT